MVDGFPAREFLAAKEKEIQRMKEFGVFEVVPREATLGKKVITTRFENQWKGDSIRAPSWPGSSPMVIQGATSSALRPTRAQARSST
eukprot:9394122-Lingulodinium_polyedra.AAC.1